MFLADSLPTASPIVISNGVLYLFGLIWLINTVVNVVVAIRSSMSGGMPRAEVEKELARLNAEALRMDEAHRSDTAAIFQEIRNLSSSVSSSMNDVTRCLGKLEGSQEFAHAFKETLAKLLDRHQ